MDVTRPKLVCQVLTSDKATWVFEQNLQNSEWLLLKADTSAVFVELPGTGVQLEKTESDKSRRHGLLNQIIGRATKSHKGSYFKGLARHIKATTCPLTMESSE